jgi:hypothetical protein
MARIEGKMMESSSNELLTARNIEEIKECGFLKVRHTIDLSAETAAYQQEIDRCLENQKGDIRKLGGYFAGHLNFNEYEVAMAIFDKLITHTTLTAICDYLGVDDVRIRTNSNLNFPRSKFQHWHFDGDYKNNFMILNVPLIPISFENGPTEVLRGSHREVENFRRFVKAYRDEAPMKLPMQLDEITFRDSRLWHRGTPNASHRIRPMLAFIFERAKADQAGWQTDNKRAYVYNNMYGSSIKGRAKEILLVQSRRLGYVKRYLLNEV